MSKQPIHAERDDHSAPPPRPDVEMQEAELELSRAATALLGGPDAAVALLPAAAALAEARQVLATCARHRARAAGRRSAALTVAAGVATVLVLGGGWLRSPGPWGPPAAGGTSTDMAAMADCPDLPTCTAETALWSPPAEFPDLTRLDEGVVRLCTEIAMTGAGDELDAW